MADKRIDKALENKELLICQKLYGRDYSSLWSMPKKLALPDQMMNIRNIYPAGFIILTSEKAGQYICNLFNAIGPTKEIYSLHLINISKLFTNELNNIRDHTIVCAKNILEKYKNMDKYMIVGNKIDYETNTARSGKNSIGTFFGKPNIHEITAQTGLRECMEESRITFTRNILNYVSPVKASERIFFVCDISGIAVKIARNDDNILVQTSVQTPVQTLVE